MGLLELFKDAIKHSIKEKGHTEADRDNYYDQKYANEFVNYVVAEFGRNPFTLETKRIERYRCTPICSFSSSARLAFLYFTNKWMVGGEKPTFEKALKNDIKGKRGPTHIDVVVGNTYYECKCQEIVNKSKGKFSNAYLTSDLFMSFFSLIDKRPPRASETGKLTFKANQLGIDLPGDPEYNHLHFDLKQLICHLIAIAQERKIKMAREEEKTKLKYLFFQPSDRSRKEIEQLYKELKKERDAIFAEGTAIRKFMDKNGIEYGDFLFCEIDDIPDFIYQSAFGNSADA